MTQKPEIPWTMAAFSRYLRDGSPVPEYALDYLRIHGPAPKDAIHWIVDGKRWATLRDITNPGLAHHMQEYAKAHGRTIAPEVLEAWDREWARQRLEGEMRALVTDAVELQRDADTCDRAAVINELIRQLAVLAMKGA